MLSNLTFEMLGTALLETMTMVVVSTLISYALGLPLGVLLVTTSKNGIAPQRALNVILSTAVNLFRSVPFVILMVAVIPLARIIVGTGMGVRAIIVSLVIAAAPFVARLVEGSLLEVDRGVIEAAQSMGASNWQIITRVLLPEARPSLISGATIATTTILGYSAMSGFVGAGGLGTIAINYGYYRKDHAIMWVMVALLIIIVQIFQETGNRLTRGLDKRIR